MSTQFDFSELDALAADLGTVPQRVAPNVRKAVEVSARGMKDDWRAIAREPSGRHAKRFPGAIDYDIDDLADGVTADIGPDASKGQGALGFLEEGVGGQNTSAQNAMPLVVRAGQDDFIRGILKAGADALEP